MPTSAELLSGLGNKTNKQEILRDAVGDPKAAARIEDDAVRAYPAEPHSILRLKWRPQWELGRMLELKESSEKQRGFIDHHFCKWPLVILANGRAAIF